MTIPDLAADLVSVVDNLFPHASRPVSLHEPRFDGNDSRYVQSCLEDGWVSSVGPFVDRFEKSLADFTGAGHVLATVNGTSALHLCLMAAGVQPGDEVIVPTLTFVGTANAVAHCGAIPHFADCEARSLGLDADKLAAHLRAIAVEREGRLVNRETGRAIAAVMCTHIFGHPCDLDRVLAVTQEFGLPLIEDAAEALGSYYNGRHVGGHGLISALSFNGNKILTTGGGGAVMCDDAELAASARHVGTTAKKPHRWEFDHDQIGYNYRLPNINAALGCAQMERLDAALKAKRRIAHAYRDALADCAGLRFIEEPDYATSNYWLNAVELDVDSLDARDQMLGVLHDGKVFARPIWKAMHRLEMFAKSPRMDVSCAERAEMTIINLPSSAFLAEDLDEA